MGMGADGVPGTTMSSAHLRIELELKRSAAFPTGTARIREGPVVNVLTSFFDSNTMPRLTYTIRLSVINGGDHCCPQCVCVYIQTRSARTIHGHFFKYRCRAKGARLYYRDNG